MHLKLRHLEVFHAVMEEGSVSKAADRLYLTQPAISIALSRLEDMLGFPLFHRSKGHFAPRPEAYLLHMDAELSILAVEQFSNRARLIKQGGTGLLPSFWVEGPRQRRLVRMLIQIRSHRCKSVPGVDRFRLHEEAICSLCAVSIHAI